MATTTQHAPTPAADHAHSPEEFKKHIKGYWVIFGILLVLTAVTVGVSYLHLSTAATVTVALLVATTKGTLVCLYFMHLIDEKKLIYWTLLLVASMAVVLFAVPNFTEGETIQHKAATNRAPMPGTSHGHEAEKTPEGGGH